MVSLDGSCADLWAQGLLTVEGEMNDFTDLPPDAPWWARWLSENWREIYREISTLFMAAVGFLALLSEYLSTAPSEIQTMVSVSTLHWLMGLGSFAAIASKFVKQKEKTR